MRKYDIRKEIKVPPNQTLVPPNQTAGPISRFGCVQPNTRAYRGFSRVLVRTPSFSENFRTFQNFSERKSLLFEPLYFLAPRAVLAGKTICETPDDSAHFPAI